MNLMRINCGFDEGFVRHLQFVCGTNSHSEPIARHFKPKNQAAVISYTIWFKLSALGGFQFCHMSAELFNLFNLCLLDPIRLSTYFWPCQVQEMMAQLRAQRAEQRLPVTVAPVAPIAPAEVEAEARLASWRLEDMEVAQKSWSKQFLCVFFHYQFDPSSWPLSTALSHSRGARGAAQLGFNALWTQSDQKLTC